MRYRAWTQKLQLWYWTRRLLLVALLAVKLSRPAFPQGEVWSGQAQCQVRVQASGYEHQEIQTWTLAGGTPTQQGVMQVYAGTWSSTGQGQLAKMQGTQALAAQWSTKTAEVSGPIAMFVRGYDHRLVIKSWHSQLLSRSATQLARQFGAPGSVPANDSAVSDVYEWQFPVVEDAEGSINVAGTGTVVVGGSYLPQHSAASSEIANCSWHFQKGSPAIVATVQLPLQTVRLPTPTGVIPAATPQTITRSPATIPVAGLIQAISLISPNALNQGQQNVQVTLTGKSTAFVPGTTKADFGPGITVTSLTVASPTSVLATLSLDPTTTIGPRDLTVSTGSTAATLQQGLVVIPAEVATPRIQNIILPAVADVSPNVRPQNSANASVTITGNNHTHFSSATLADFGPGITAGPLTNVTNNRVETVLQIAAGAALGPRTVTLTTGAEVAKMANGFTVTPPAANTPASFHIDLNEISYTINSGPTAGDQAEYPWCDVYGCVSSGKAGDWAGVKGTFQPSDYMHIVIGPGGPDLVLPHSQECDDSGYCSWAPFDGSAYLAGAATSPTPAWIYVQNGTQHSNLIRITYLPQLQTVTIAPQWPSLAFTTTSFGFGADESSFVERDGVLVEHHGGPFGGNKGDDIWYDRDLTPGWFLVAVNLTGQSDTSLGGGASLSNSNFSGSTNPRITVHWWVDAAGGSSYRIHSITLLGPFGTQPFK